MNDKEEYLKGHKLILDVRDIKRDRYNDMEYEIDEANGYCTLNLTFNGNVKNLEIEINRFNSENRAM